MNDDNACEGKVRYSRSIVRRVARDMREKYQELILAYRCHECKGWHVGHPYISKLNSYLERNPRRHRNEVRNDWYVVV